MSGRRIRVRPGDSAQIRLKIGLVSRDPADRISRNEAELMPGLLHMLHENLLLVIRLRILMSLFGSMDYKGISK